MADAKPNSKGIAALIVGKMGGAKGPAPESGEAGGDDSYDDQLLMASHDMLAAIKSGDAKAFSDALHSYLDMCENEEGEAK